MKILRIEIHNIASIADAEIDFAAGPLADERIFLICGETGSGKTTILNSICLALYNSTPSLLAYGSNDKDANGLTTRNSSQMLRRGAREGWVNLDFEANDGIAYRAVWSARKIRTRDKSLKVDVKTRIERAADGVRAEVPIAALTGLTFKQFTQTTILAQGQFTKFLLADEAEKAEILEKLTGTEIYAAIGQRIYERLKQKETALNSLNDRIAGAKLLDEGERQALADELPPLRDAISKRAAELASLDARLKWLADGRAIADRLEANKAERDKAEAYMGGERYRSMAEQVSIWEETAWVRRLMAEADEAGGALASARESRPALKRRYSAILGGITALEALRKARQADLDALRAKAGDCDIDAITAQAASLRAESVALSRASSAIDRYHASKARSAQAADALQSAEADVDARRALIERHAAAIPPLESDYRAKQAYLEGMMELKDHIASLRRAFEDSRQCPLCGSKHVDMATDAAIDEKLAEAAHRAQAAKSALEKESAAMAAARTALKVINADIERKRRESNAARQALETDRTAARKAAAAIGVDCDDEAYAAAIEQRAADVNKALAISEQRLRDALAARTAAERIAALDARIADARRSTERLEAAFPGTEAAQVDEMPRLTAEIAALTAETAALDGRIESLGALLADRRAAIDAYMAAEGSCSAEQINAAAALTTDYINAAKAEIKAAADRLLAATAAVSEIERQSAEHQTAKPEMGEADTPESLADARRQADAERDGASQRLAAVEALLADDDKRAMALAQTKRERDALEAERADWAVLEDLYGGAKGQKFRLMAQCYVLRTLLHKANHYLALLTSRYELCCADNSLVINVIDRDQGGAVRPVTLLSGGESFIVSLALALGLSTISKERLDVDTLFIDEGFGTLDSATLETVLTTLDRLHSIGGRRVGIISHVAGLSERIPVQIRLRRTNPATSSVEIVAI